jgi:lipoate-protein ligase A
MWIDDEVLRRCREPVALGLWVPKSPMVVLGSSNQAAVEAAAEACEADQVPILKRFGGGGAVVLHAGCAVVSLGCWVAQLFNNRLYFDGINRAVILALGERWPELAQLQQGGLSDLTCAAPDGGPGLRKVAGTSLFRSRNYLLYQASILIESRLPVIERYLRYPSKEPDYRGGRSHAQFIMGLNEILPELTAAGCVEQLRLRLEAALHRTLGSELVQPRPEQWDGLLRRAGP